MEKKTVHPLYNVISLDIDPPRFRLHQFAITLKAAGQVETAKILQAHLTELSAGVSKLKAEVEKTVGPRPRKHSPKEPERD